MDSIVESALHRANISLSTKVSEIAFSDAETDNAGLIKVSTANGQPQFFDAVVNTTPLGYLKRNLDMFKPALPSPLLSAIAHISYGRLEKVYLTFREAFWSVVGTSSPFFSQFVHPMYALEQNPMSWSVECASLASLPEPCGHPTILFYIHGPCAEHVTSLINGVSLDDSTYLKVLDDFFRPYYSRLPNYSEQRPTTALATNWQNDELAGYGSYTNFQVACSIEDGGEEILVDKDIELLRHGAPERNLWFAGEHTAPFVALGTVTGAYWSGETVAQRILEAYGVQDKSGPPHDNEGPKAEKEGTIDGTGPGGWMT